MKKFLLALCFVLGQPVAAQAQGVPNSATVVAVCGTPPTTYSPGQIKSLLQNAQGNLCDYSTATANQGTAGAAPWPVAATEYPIGATPLTISTVGTTLATTATLAGAASKTTYLCGFSIRASAASAATGNATVTGVITGTMNFTQWTAPAASGLGITEPNLGHHCIPASGTNQAIAVVSAAPGSSGVISVTAWGYQL